MGAMSRNPRSSFSTGAHGRAPGFSLIELMFTLSLGGIVLALAVPSFGRAVADIRTRATAQQLAGALRLARVSAVTRNRPAALVVTDARPASDAPAAVNGSRWVVRFLPPMPAPETTAAAEPILVMTAAPRNGVVLTGPAQVCFDAQGLQTSAPDTVEGPAGACAPPGEGAGGATSYLVSRANATGQYRVRVWRSGRVDICETTRTPGTDPGACP
jgi:type IV fimbrial biogenesis protein FimT